VVNSFILAGALTFGQPVAEVMPDQDAPRYVVKALYRELDLNDVVSELEKKYLNIEDYPEIVYIGIIGRIVTERRVTYRWEF
jgi:hypothetical protein